MTDASWRIPEGWTVVETDDLVDPHTSSLHITLRGAQRRADSLNRHNPDPTYRWQVIRSTRPLRRWLLVAKQNRLELREAAEADRILRGFSDHYAQARQATEGTQ
jgi:hypothetical protein